MNIATVLMAIRGELPRDRGNSVWAFPNTWLLSGTELN